MTKTLSEAGIEGNSLHLIKYLKSLQLIHEIRNCEILNAFPFRSRQDENVCYYYLYSTLYWRLKYVQSWGKRNKRHTVWKLKKEKYYLYGQDVVYTRFKGIYSLLKLIRDFPSGPVTKTARSQCRGPGIDPWSGNKIPCSATRWKILHAATKTWFSQINKK